MHPAVESLLTSCVLMLAILLTGTKALFLFPIHHENRQRWDALPWKSGDLLLCSLAGFQHDVLKFCFHCRVTHVGLVVAARGGRRFVWEATRRGVQLIPIEEYAMPPRSVCLYRPLRGGPAPDARKLWDFVHMHAGRRYSHEYWRPVYNRLFPYLPLATPHDRKTRFCTDLAAETLEHLGVLDFAGSPRTPADMIPADFTETYENLPLVPPYYYDEEIMIAC